MKIALMSPYDLAYPGGVTTHVVHLAEEFRSRGHAVKILAPCSPRWVPPPEMDVAPIGRPVPVPTAGSVARVSFSVWLEPKIRSLLRRERFDVVHVHEPFIPFLSWLVVLNSPTTTIGTFHAFNERGFRLRIWKPLLKYTDARLDGRIAVSEAARRYINKYFPREYEIIPNGIDVDHFARPTAPLAEFDDGHTNIVFVGRAEKRKGLRYLLGAYSKLKWRFPDLRLIVVGPGNPNAEASRIIGERGLEDVVFTGAVSFEDLPRYYQAAHIFCSPATGHESFGLVLVEAMSGGRPIVATNIDGYTSVITHGEQGLLVPPRDEGALAEALATLIDDPSLRQKLGANGRETVEQYRWGRVASRVLDFYDTVANARLASARGS